MLKNKHMRTAMSLILTVMMILGIVIIPKYNIKSVDAADAYITVTALRCYDYCYEVLDYVNEERRKNGLCEVTMDVDLMEAAMQRAAESAVIGAAYNHSEIDNSRAHTRPDGTSCFTVSGKAMGENIAYGQKTPFSVMYNQSKDIDPNNSDDMDKSSWMRSSGHRDNILYGLKSTDKASWKSVGIGMVYYAGNYYYYWSQEFSAYEATNPAQRRSDRVTTTFTVGVTSEIYSRLQSRGVLKSGDSIGSGSSGSSGGSGSGGGQPNGPVRGEWKNDGRGWWFSLSDGSYAQNCWLKSGDKWYAFGEDGYMITGWAAIDGTWYYFHSDGHMASSEWVNGYWLSGNGGWTYEGVGSWHGDGSGWWYSDSSGWYPVNQWQKIDGKWYYFDGSGYMVTNRSIDGYYLGPDGAMQ